MIQRTIAEWHRFVSGEEPDALDALLAEDCVFYSPVVYAPQRGKDVTKLYLTGAAATFAGAGFRYTKQVLVGTHAVLEFEAELDGRYVNGVDIITCDDEGRIAEFRVMIRPLQAVNAVHQRMAAMLEQMKGATPA